MKKKNKICNYKKWNLLRGSILVLKFISTEWAKLKSV